MLQVGEEIGALSKIQNNKIKIKRELSGFLNIFCFSFNSFFLANGQLAIWQKTISCHPEQVQEAKYAKR